MEPDGAGVGGRSRHYDMNGKPMTMMQWAQAFKDTAGRVLARTDLPDAYWVSTVWLGFDHNFGDGPPLIFESMVFKEDTHDEVACRRYATREEALAGHRALCQEWGELRCDPKRRPCLK